LDRFWKKYFEGDQKVISISKWNHRVAGHRVAGNDDADFE